MLQCSTSRKAYINYSYDPVINIFSFLNPHIIVRSVVSVLSVVTRVGSFHVAHGRSRHRGWAGLPVGLQAQRNDIIDMLPAHTGDTERTVFTFVDNMVPGTQNAA